MAIQVFLFVSFLIFSSSIESNHGATEVSLFTNLENSLEVTAKPLRDGVVLEAGKDMVRITWMLKSSGKVDGDTAFKTVEVKLCYAPISQVDRPWRKTHNELSRDRSCPHKIVSKPYDKIPQSLNWTIDRETPTGTYFVRAYGTDVNGQEVAYGQSSDAEKTTNLFSVEGISGRHTSLDIASICFSVFSFGSLLVFLVKEKRKAKLQQLK
ncbi:high-affinity nitrate transporter 3.2 isoform X2 [Brassica rapa]|uniref:high-affinity nitrate transporter 3.2 isoform X2 n=1 Tax=Brassica campestris TaxID=3711 RepID=UPI0004F1B4D4|nr:high-affinity nitrate transporter 3.2 isoform X2 [Brassica rapa]